MFCIAFLFLKFILVDGTETCYFQVILVVTSVISVVLFKVVSRVDWFKSLPNGSLASSLTSSILNTISILILGRVYKTIAYKLTDWGKFYCFNFHHGYLNAADYGKLRKRNRTNNAVICPESFREYRFHSNIHLIFFLYIFHCVPDNIYLITVVQTIYLKVFKPTNV